MYINFFSNIVESRARDFLDQINSDYDGDESDEESGDEWFGEWNVGHTNVSDFEKVRTCINKSD